MAWMTFPAGTARSTALRNGRIAGGDAAAAAPDHPAMENVERGEQGGRAVALVVMGHRPAFSGLQRQTGLRAVKRLDLSFLVDRDDDRVGGRVHVEATMSSTFATNSGSLERLKVRMRWGCSRCASQKRCTALCQMPTASPSPVRSNGWRRPAARCRSGPQPSQRPWRKRSGRAYGSCL